MSLPLTPAHVVAAYEFLRALPPMSAWKLPHSDEIVFVVNKSRFNMGTYQYGPGERHEIACSMRNIGHTDTLLRTVAHEMLHLAQVLQGTQGKDKIQHNAEFVRLAKRVCRYHGWDAKQFA